MSDSDREYATDFGGSSCITSLLGAFLDVDVEANRTGEAEEGSAGEQNDGGDMHVAGEA
jgi:hypothetical protein